MEIKLNINAFFYLILFYNSMLLFIINAKPSWTIELQYNSLCDNSPIKDSPQSEFAEEIIKNYGNNEIHYALQNK